MSEQGYLPYNKPTAFLQLFDGMILITPRQLIVTNLRSVYVKFLIHTDIYSLGF